MCLFPLLAPTGAVEWHHLASELWTFKWPRWREKKTGGENGHLCVSPIQERCNGRKEKKTLASWPDFFLLFLYIYFFFAKCILLLYNLSIPEIGYGLCFLHNFRWVEREHSTGRTLTENVRNEWFPADFFLRIVWVECALFPIII